MFRGLHPINLDEKGRMAIPTRYRLFLESVAEGKLILTIDTEMCCLLLYPLSDWETIEKKIEALPSFNQAARRIQRLLLGHATELDLDTQGRILLPQPLREYAGLEKRLLLVGQGKKFEIWDEARWTLNRNTWLEAGINSELLPSELQSLAL